MTERLAKGERLSKAEFIDLIVNREKVDREKLYALSRQFQHEHFGKRVFLRGLIEFSSFCRNDCLYCGIRRSNCNAERYRLTKEQIMSACELGHELGYRTFVLQGGEDMHYTGEVLEDIVRSIKKSFPDCAITLSVGERSTEDYKRWFDAGADRYLLRHETANEEHYKKLHPADLSLKHRMECLYELKDIGYQVGAGFMVGSPFQTPETLADDLLFLKDLEPHMIGIGPFIPHHDTPFANEKAGTVELTLFLLAIIRIMLPDVLLPATTALGTVAADGREQGILAGANVLMPNLSPKDVRGKYLLYDNKICTGEEAAECKACLDNRIKRIGYETVTDRGDSPRIRK
ncbi:MAG: [FeFe] hydrogenase H-cluster radical SAM maturase HydE [Lachnospiraceae bacterium]|nr:[FeFe] hydrogenase H-cluster radical SAM maturase HydE [Lachnospiraceae bacterium]